MDYSTAYQLALERPENYWGPFASSLKWFKGWEKALDGRSWFVNGKTNIAWNSLSHGGKALIWYGERGYREVSYDELDRMSRQIASRLPGRGKRVAIYMPNTPEAIATVLACARKGVIYSLIFAGLGEEAVKVRLDDFKPDLLVKADKTYRRGKEIPLYFKGDVVLEREKALDFSEEFKGFEEVESNEPLKVMYTSGTTGRPKGIILPHGAWMVGDYVVFNLMFSLKPGDVVFTTADIGWITFSRIMYATLLHGATLVFMEGAPDYPKDRVAKIIDEVRPKVFFTSPTLLRLLRKLNVKPPRVEFAATAGEIMDEASWDFVKTFSDRYTDVYGQTEMGYVVGTPFSLGVEPKKPFAGVPFPGAVLDTVDEEGKHVDGVGELVLKTPFPTQFIGVLNNEEKYREYMRFGFHHSGDLAVIEGGYVRIVGRTDDMIKVAGHRLTSGEVEAVIQSIPGVVEVAAVGVPDEVKGEVIDIFVVGEVNEEEVRKKVRDSLGPIYVVDKVFKVNRLPRSRSGKVMRRALRDALLGKKFDETLLEDPEVMREIIEAIESKKSI
ncbi:MAG: AMP-binding protein [Candidatus Aramenus sulfurataquae]|jgi:acetyl-CoA synthetase|uniref:AMP-binding protein n=2 Tax=Candidatus Aramenus sulfurataquae TaxID=1326980 RepID=A0A0F2LL22_9CREN|nr:AMP-binding protein [Candidatus Aramenus sulfurataquae]